VIREFNEFVPGEDPRDVDRLARLMRTAMGATGTAGMGFHAISGVETALWDIVGKASNLPVYQFLGGKYRERVRIFLDCHAGKGLSSLSAVLLPRTPGWAQKRHKAERGEGWRKDLPARAELIPKYHGAEVGGAQDLRRGLRPACRRHETPRLHSAQV
jgi:L-alanine-DL-glutamate epimerase-like enolase superfamily enzyme